MHALDTGTLLIWQSRCNESSTLGEGVDVSARGRVGRSVFTLGSGEESRGCGRIPRLERRALNWTVCKNIDGMTPLHVATTEGQPPAVNALVSAGSADISLRTNNRHFFGSRVFVMTGRPLVLLRIPATWIS